MVYDLSMLAGKCPKCGYECVGWGLRFPRHQACARCGSGLEITEDGKPIGIGYSPFTAAIENPGMRTEKTPKQTAE